MTPSDRRAAASIMVAALDALLSSGGNGAGQQGAELRRRCGALSASAADQVEAGAYGEALRSCFKAATAAGATFEGMERVRVTASISSQRPTVTQVAQACIRFALIEMSLILTVTTFASRPDADAALARINAAYGPAAEFAANERSADVYQALVALHAASVRDLTQRARQLPRVVPFAFAQRMPALTLANRIYGDGERYAELAAENRVVHPLFCPEAGRALAV